MALATLLLAATRHRFARTSSEHYAAAEIGGEDDYEAVISEQAPALDYHAQVSRASGYGGAAIAAASTRETQIQHRQAKQRTSRQQRNAANGNTGAHHRRDDSDDYGSGYGQHGVTIDGGTRAPMPTPVIHVARGNGNVRVTTASSSAPTISTPLLSPVSGGSTGKRVSGSKKRSNASNKPLAIPKPSSSSATPPSSAGLVSSPSSSAIRVSLPSPSSRRAIDHGTFSQPQSLSSSPTTSTVAAPRSPR